MTIPPQTPTGSKSKKALPLTNLADFVQAQAARSAQAGQEPAKPKPLQAVRHGGQLMMAENFVQEHKNYLRRVHGAGWNSWDNRRWVPDTQRVEIRAAVRTLKAARRRLSELNGKEMDDLYKDIRACESMGALEAISRLAGTMFPISVSSEMMDDGPHLFNTPDGTVNLTDCTVRDHSRNDLLTKVSTGSITGETSEVWENFLARVLPDEEVRSFVQRLFGYSMLGQVTEHVLPILNGPGGNGKSVLQDAIMHAFGDYADAVDPAILMESKNERHGAFKMKLKAQRLVFCSETDRGRRFSEATMKRLVGGDPIEANYMYQNPVTFLPSHTLVMLTNHLPKVSADDPAVWRRILVVPFDVVIPPEERDPKLTAKLKAVPNAVLTWVYQGWLAYQEQGLNPPEAVRVRTQAYQEDNSALGRFLEERTMPNEHSRIRARDLYTAWSNWCHEVGERPGPEKTFAGLMEAAGYQRKATNVGRQYVGLMLLGEDQGGEEEGWPAGARRAAPRPPAEPVQTEISGTR